MKRAVVALAWLVTLVPASYAQQATSPPAADPATIFRTGTNLVPLNVTVTDQSNHFIKGLTVTDFAVFEDGVQQQVQFFEATEVPLDLILLLDTSS